MKESNNPDKIETRQKSSIAGIEQGIDLFDLRRNKEIPSSLIDSYENRRARQVVEWEKIALNTFRSSALL